MADGRGQRHRAPRTVVDGGEHQLAGGEIGTSATGVQPEQCHAGAEPGTADVLDDRLAHHHVPVGAGPVVSHPHLDDRELDAVLGQSGRPGVVLFEEVQDGRLHEGDVAREMNDAARIGVDVLDPTSHDDVWNRRVPSTSRLMISSTWSRVVMSGGAIRIVGWM